MARDEFDIGYLDDMREAAEERAAKRRHACQCAGDMPGKCPGPENCPMAFGCDLEDEE